MHDDLARALAVTARIEQRDLGSVVRDIRELLAGDHRPCQRGSPGVLVG
jgi:hypothetical protein